MFCQRLQSGALSPEADSAVTAALAPGMGMTRKPAARSASTSTAPGSLTAGVQASVTSATLLSCCSKAMTFSVAPRSLCWCSASRRVSLMP